MAANGRPFPNGPCYFSNRTTGEILSASYSCAPGFYCPNIVENDPSTLPVVCPPSDLCQYDRLYGDKVCL
eukprot:jgi/Hompol1/3967/HPOL_006919-RA